MKKLFILSVMCFMSLTIQAQRCAVLDFQVGSNVTDEEIDAISYIFRAHFLPSNYSKLERIMVNRTIRDFGYSRTSMTQEQMMRVGRELEANIIVVGTINKFMDEYSADIRVIDVGKNITITYENATFQKASYRDVMENVAIRLASKLYGSSETSASNSVVPSGYTDLGLPSGTLWNNDNVTGFYTYEEAVSQFGNRLPTKEQWQELIAKCQWSWTGSGYIITGSNGNSIDLPAEGGRNCDGCVVYNTGIVGFYWSSLPYVDEDDDQGSWSLIFAPDGIEMSTMYRSSGISVRLVNN